MTQADIPAVLYVQRECYESVTQEDEVTIRARLRVSPDSAWVAEDERGVCAYLVAYRSAVGKVTPLGGLFAVHAAPDSLYLHDLAIAARCKGSGIGSALVRFAGEKALAEGLAFSSLVSVHGSLTFWQKLGYVHWDNLDPSQRANLQSYAGEAWYMVKPLRA